MLNIFSVVLAQKPPDPIVKADTPNQLSDLEPILQNVLGLILPLGAVVLFVVLMYGGIKYITAGANPGAVENAKKTLTYGIAGMILLAMAYLILVMVELITGANVTDFSLNF